MPKNYNIQTAVVNPLGTTGKPKTVGAIVAAGKTRYVTFISVTPRGDMRSAGCKLLFCSTSTEAKASTLALASAAAKYAVIIASAPGAPKSFQSSAKIDTENPLFSIAEGRYLTIRQASTAVIGSTACSVFVQYYDQ